MITAYFAVRFIFMMVKTVQENHPTVYISPIGRLSASGGTTLPVATFGLSIPSKKLLPPRAETKGGK